MLPPAPPGVIPYITAWSNERLLTPQLVHSRRHLGVGYEDETPYDRDSWGQLWARPALLPKARRGHPNLRKIHPYRQRRAMLNMMCQVCSLMPTNPDGPYLFLMRGTFGPVRERERTTSPPVCVPCAAISVQQCTPLRDGRYVTAWVDAAPVWGVAGVFYSPRTLTSTVSKLERIEYGDDAARWTIAHRQVVELHGVRPADLDAEIARLGTDRLEQEFARVAGLVGARR